MSTTLSGPRLLPPLAVGSYPLLPAADGRLWKYCGRGLPEESVNRLADQLAADRLAVRGEYRALGLVVQPGDEGHQPNEQWVAETDRSR